MGRISTGDGGTDSFWWRSTSSRYFRFTVHKASSPEGAIVNELKLRILNKDRMPIGRLERAALSGRGDLYPQSLLGHQVYWTVLGEFDQAEEALFDEYGHKTRGRATKTASLLVLLSKPEGVSVKTWPTQKDGKAIQYEAPLPDTSATSWAASFPHTRAPDGLRLYRIIQG